MVRKIGSIALTIVGIAVLVAATVSLVSERLSLPSDITEERWDAYGLHQWVYWIGELPLSLILLVTGLLLWPSRPHNLMTKLQGFLLLGIALVGLVHLVCTAYSLASSWWDAGFDRFKSEILPHLPEFLLTIAFYFGPMLATTILGAIGAWRRLSFGSAKKTLEEV